MALDLGNIFKGVGEERAASYCAAEDAKNLENLRQQMRASGELPEPAIPQL